MYYGTVILAYHPRRKKAVRNQTPVKVLNYSNLSNGNSQTNTNLVIEIKITVLDVVIPHMHKDLIARLRNTNANIAQKSDISQRCALPKMYTCCHNTIIKVSQNRHIKSLYLNILLSNQNTHVCDNDDDFMIAFQLHAQPQKNVHNQQVTTGYTQKHLYANIPYQLQPYHKHNTYL